MARQYLEQSNRMMQRNSAQNRGAQSFPTTPLMSVPPPPEPPRNPYRQGEQSRNPATRFEQMPLPAYHNYKEELNPPKPPPQKSRTHDPNSTAGELTDGLLNIDGEKLLIILIMILLIKEKADMKLIVALGYLLT